MGTKKNNISKKSTTSKKSQNVNNVKLGKASTNSKKVSSKNRSSVRKKAVKKVEKKQSDVKEVKVEKNEFLKKLYIIIIVILSTILLISSTIEIINVITPSENILPSNPMEENNPIDDESEYDKIISLFSDDYDLDFYRKENNNAEIVGRVEAPGVFNLLLTQTKDNDYYIDYNIKRKRSDKGTEFVDYRTKLTDKQVNVYGHNSRLYDLPFKNIEKYLEEDFFNENEYLLIQHEKGRRIYHIAAIKRIVTDYEHMVVDTTLKTHVQHIDKLLADSTHKRDLTYDKDTNILVLQTCTREKKVNAYYILIAFEINE